MKFLCLPVLILLTSSLYSQKVPKKNVLFIGNSLTYYSGMPDYLKAMIKVTNQELNIEVSAYPGMSLEAHLNDIIEARNGEWYKHSKEENR